MTLTHHIVIYCNASPTVGLGHFVRCIALAEALRSQQNTIVSFCGEITDTWAKRQIADRAFAPVTLVSFDSIAVWVSRISEMGPDVVIVDSYDITDQHFQQLKSINRPIVAIDDCADRMLDVDLILNANLNAESLNYELSPCSNRILGTNYLLLRPELIERAQQCPNRSFPKTAHKLAVIMGGTDPKGWTPIIIESLLKLKQEMHIKTIVSRSAQRAAIEKLETSGSGHKLEVFDRVSDIGTLFCWADLAIVAAGSIVWELAVFGCPMVIMQVAENQRIIVENLKGSGAAVCVEPPTNSSMGEHSQLHIQEVINSASSRIKLSDQSRKLVDGLGAQRVVSAIFQLIL
jgi:UDP-2,4-diacetamido-2,4,6-trideoxy-beta-L-altropyranose hydrolase